jgi:LysM repeat protein
MKRINVISLIAVIWLMSAVAAAEEEPLDIVDDETQASASEGVHLNANDTQESVLARAARMGASVVISSGEEGGYETSSEPVLPRSDVYTVKVGDTLWDISTRFFGDAYVWPRIWSYNPEVSNPNWIYPGDILRLLPNAPLTPDGTMKTESIPFNKAGTVNMPENAILMRSRGFVDKEILKKSGELVGAHKEVALLSQYDEGYVEFPEEKVAQGQKFAAFTVLREVDSIDDPDTEIGKLVEIKGLVRVVSFDKKTKIARVAIEEAINPIERGTLIGPVHRLFDMIPAVRNGKNLTGNIIAFLDLGTLAASQQVVFVDRGKEEGVKEGNRFLAVEKRDGLRRIDNEPDDKEGYPTEVLAEIRVVETRPHTSTCLITHTVRELEVGQKVEMRKGF